MPAPGQQTPDARDESKGFLSDLLQTRYREVTLSAVVFAILIGIVMNAAITYAGLKIGFTIGGSAIAAVLGFGVLRGILRRGSILETNIAQTIASAVNTSNSGVIFTVPVLLLIGYQLTIGGTDFWLITLACVAGAILGSAFIIPLRKQMLDIERLRFPTPTAVASILKSPGAGPAKAVVLLVGIVIGAIVYLPAGLPTIAVLADADELDELFEEGRITHEQRLITRDLAQWINEQTPPGTLVNRGKALSDLAALEATVADGGTLTPQEQAAKARLEDRIGDLKVGALHSDETAIGVYKARRGDISWDSLQDAKYGWAERPLLGYSDLNWRLPRDPETAERDDDGDGEMETLAVQAELDGDSEPDTLLTREVDRDQDGRADLLMTDTTVDAGRLLGMPAQYQFLIAIAPFALGAGYLTGRAGLFVLAGGILAFFVLNPLAFSMGWMPASVTASAAPGYGFQAFNRPLGIGLLLGGAMMGILASIPAVRAALVSIASASKIKGGSEELGIKTLAVAVVAAVLFLFLAADFMGNKPINLKCPVTTAEISSNVDAASYNGYAIGFATAEAAETWENDWTIDQRDAYMTTLNAKKGWLSGLNPHLRALIIALIGGAWIWFAGIIIAQCAGMTDWSPISGLALLTVVLVLLLAGSGAVMAAVLIGAALCVATTLAADMMGDLKTGYLVGAQPKRQQVVELVVVGIGPIVAMLTIVLIAASNVQSGEPPMGGTSTPAPQAQALQAVIVGMQGGEMPFALYGFGAAIGLLLGLGSFAGLGVLVGLSMYLPFQYITTYGIGCVIQIIVAKIFGKSKAEAWGVPFCAGLIVGEALLALVINIYVLVPKG